VTNASTRRSAPDNHLMRDRILAAALKLFARDGFDGTTVRGIADTCGLTDAALYYYFPTKRSILEALLTRPRQAWRSWAPQGGALTAELIGELVDATLDGIADEGPLYRVILDQAIDGDRTALALRARAAASGRRRLLAVFGDAESELSADRTEAFTMLIHGAVLSLYIDHDVAFTDLADRHDVRAHIKEVVLAALGADNG
jgi:AcrR family transcriptional regulator